VAASRPYWKGYLKLSLVSCPIALFAAASSTERVSFRQINKQTGNRLRQQLVDEVTREVVDSADKERTSWSRMACQMASSSLRVPNPRDLHADVGKRFLGSDADTESI
jgi:hypothetical protein